MQVSSEKVAKEIMQRKQEYLQELRQYESALEAKETSRRLREAYVQTRLASDIHFGELKKMKRIQHYDNLKKAAVRNSCRDFGRSIDTVSSVHKMFWI